MPRLKDARVLIALGFESASIVELLDWRPGARLPLEAQGNHILVGKGATNEMSIKHAYEDAKPALTIQRSSSNDQQVIKVSEGTIRFETKSARPLHSTRAGWWRSRAWAMAINSAKWRSFTMRRAPRRSQQALIASF